MHGAAPAAYRALEIIEAAKDGDLQKGFDAEDTALADLIMGGELRAGIYSFNLVQKRGKPPAPRNRQEPGAPGHQGRRRRRRSDGLAARAALPAPP
ncbi:hypothetical protein SALBM135S_05103 [Streptomyces alboniger]